MVLKWSSEDNAYLVYLPEWEELAAQPVADGPTDEEAARRGGEVTFEEAVERDKNALENYLQFSQEDGIPLPPPRTFAA